MWGTILEIISVILLAAVEVLAAIPAGFAFGHHFLMIIAETTLGAILGAIIIVKFGDRLRLWLLKRKKPKKPSPRRDRFKRIYEKYGVVGTGLLAPLITGVPLGVALSVAAGATAGKNILWASFGTFIWTVIFTLLGELGIEIFG